VITLLIAGATLPGLASGVLATPDTALALAWSLALHEGFTPGAGFEARGTNLVRLIFGALTLWVAFDQW